MGHDGKMLVLSPAVKELGLMERLKELLSLYAFPVILLLIGGVMTAYRFGNNQTDLFLIAGATITLVGAITLLNAVGLIGRTAQTVVLVLLVPGALYLGYLNFSTIKDELAHREKVDRMKSVTIQGLKDVRKVQTAFKERYGHYTPSYDTLLNFLKRDSLSFVKMAGTRPDTLTEEEALKRDIIQRDTLFSPVLDSLFDPNEKGDFERKERAYRFTPDSLPYKHGTDKKFIMDAGAIEESGGIQSPVFLVKDPDPFRKKGDTLQIGSMKEAKTSGNWGGYD